MRLWAKLLVIVAVALGVQECVERNSGWLDETWFAVRVGLHNLVPGSDPNDPSLMASALTLMERQRERACYTARTVAAEGNH